jgi:hypothetical protein
MRERHAFSLGQAEEELPGGRFGETSRQEGEAAPIARDDEQLLAGQGGEALPGSAPLGHQLDEMVPALHGGELLPNLLEQPIGATDCHRPYPLPSVLSFFTPSTRSERSNR